MECAADSGYLDGDAHIVLCYYFSNSKSVEDEQKELFDQLMKRIKDKNSSIKINDCYITPAQKEQELFDKHFEMCGSIYKLNNNLVNRKG